MLRMIAAVLALLPAPVLADSFMPVSDRASFMALVQGRELKHGFYPIALNVLENGQITGRAVGWDIAGSWDWQDGYFCRDLNWGGDALGYNCQLVEATTTGRIRFTSDRGTGDSAAFRLQ